jgi:hypothetical protein
MSESEYNIYMRTERKIAEMNGIPTISNFDQIFLEEDLSNIEE